MSEMLADLLMLLHACFSLFVVFGLVLILVGMIFRWQWTRHRWFRMLHLAATMIVVARVWLALPCPFSVAEDRLRLQIVFLCPLGNPVHGILHCLAFRGKNPRRFAYSTTLVGALALAATILSGRAFGDIKYRRARKSG